MSTGHQFLSLLARYFAARRALTAILALVVVTAATDLAAPWLVMLAIDLLVGAEAGTPVAAAGDTNAVFTHLLLLAGALAVVCTLQYAARYGMTRLQARAVYRGAARLRDDLHDRLQEQTLSFHTSRRAGETLAHLMTDVQVLQDAAIDLSTELPFDALVLLGLCTAMCLLAPLLGLVVLAFFAVAVGAALGLGRRGWAAHRAVLQSNAALTADLQESLGGLRTTWFSGGAARERERMQREVAAHSERLVDSGAVRAVVTPFLGLSEYLGVLLVLVLGGWSMLHHDITAGGLVALLAYMEMGAEPLARAAEAVDRFQKAAAAGARLQALLTAAKTTPASRGSLRPPGIRGHVRAIGLGFAHAGSRQPALRELDFTIEPGEVVGVIGRTGAGKSTLLDLLAGLHAPTQGRIEIDGIDLATIDQQHWRALVGAVPQEVFLQNRSIADNIGYGADLAAVRRAAECAGIDEFVRQLPRGYDTPAGDRGVLLSGGERQRIAVARLFLRDPRIVLLDEPTSALDVETERQLLAVFHRLFAGRTTFLVTHRPLLLAAVDKLLVLQQGRLTYCGAPGGSDAMSTASPWNRPIRETP